MAGWLPLFAPGGPSGSFQLGIGTLRGGIINVLKLYGSQAFPTNTGPSDLDVDGYPIATLANNIGGAVDMPSNVASNSTIYVLKSTGTRHLQFVINTNVTLDTTTLGGASTSGGVSISGGSNSALTVTFTGPGKVYFKFTGYVGPTWSLYFPSGYANTSGTGEIALMRVSDEPAYDAGTYFTPEFIALLRDLNPQTVRTMGWSHNGGAGTNEVQWRYRTAPSRFSWVSDKYNANVNVTASTSDNIAYICGNATDSNASAYVDGEVLQMRWPAAANANSTPTLNRNSLGAKSIVGMDGLAIFTSQIPASSLATFIYDGVLGKFLYAQGYADGSGATQGGITSSVPIEAHVQLANTVNANLWFSFPNLADDTYVSTAATYIRDNLNAQLKAYFEYSNEIWNNAAGFYQTNWAYRRGLAFGFPNANNEPSDGWYGLRVRQIMAAVTTIWTATRPASSLKRVLAVWAANFASVSQQMYRLNGADLNGTTYPVYGSYAGANYDTSPNRPIDYCDVLSYAVYYQGANYGGGNYDPASATVLQTAARNFALGGASAATALAWLDNDIRAGTLSGTVGDQTLLGFSQSGGVYPLYEAIAASYDAARNPDITVEAYEGALQCQGPTTAQCTTLGITADYFGSGLTAAGASASLIALLEAYKNDVSYGYGIAFDYFTQFRGASFPHATVPSWLQISGPNVWSLLQGDLGSTPYKTYNGVKAFH